VILADALFAGLRTDGVITSDQLAQGIQKTLDIYSDLVVDLPKAPRFVGIIIGGAIARGHLQLAFLKNLDPLISGDLAPQLGLEIFDAIQKTKTDVVSESSMWSWLPKFWKPNTPESQISKYITDKKMTHLFPSVFAKTQIEAMIKEGGPVDSILKWIEHNAPDVQVDVNFVRWLMRTVLKQITNDEAKPKIQHYSKLLKRFLSESEDLQFECLFEVQAHWASVGAPKELLSAIFSSLYDSDVIMEDAYQRWAADAKDTTPKKAEAVASASDWLKWLSEAEEESDDESK